MKDKLTALLREFGEVKVKTVPWAAEKAEELGLDPGVSMSVLLHSYLYKEATENPGQPAAIKLQTISESYEGRKPRESSEPMVKRKPIPESEPSHSRKPQD